MSQNYVNFTPTLFAFDIELGIQCKEEEKKRKMQKLPKNR